MNARLFPFRRSEPHRRFAALVRPHLERLHRLALRYCGHREDAEDLVQSLLLKLLPQLERLEEVDDPGQWLSRALHNAFIDQTRRRAIAPLDRTGGVDAEDSLLLLEDEGPESPEEYAERHFTQARLLAALDALPPEQRALIAWHDIEGYTLEELCKAENLPLGTVKSRLHRARARLRQLLMEPF